MKRRASLAAAGLLAGCTVGPKHPTTTLSLAPPAAPTVIAPTAGPAQTLLAGPTPRTWWAAFGSEKLNALVAAALAHSEDIAIAEATLRQTREQARATAGASLPQADLGYQYERARVSNVLSSPLIDQAQQLYSLHTAQVTVTYPVDLFGLQRNRTRSARAAAEVAAERLEAARRTLVANLVTAVIGYAALGEQVAATQESIRSNSEILELLRRRQAIGDIGAADVAAQQTSLATAQGSLPALQRQQERQRALIATMLGLAAGSDLPPLPGFAELALPAQVPVSLPAAIVADRPDVRAAAAQMRGAGADVGAAIAARLPQFTLAPQAGSQVTNFADLFASGTGFWTLLAGVTQPLFHGGQLKHQQRAAEAALDGAKAQYRAAALQAFADVDDALTGLRTDAEALDAADRANAAAGLTLLYGRRQLALGGIGTLALLNASSASAVAAANLVQARAARMTDTVALFQATGGAIDAAPQPPRP